MSLVSRTADFFIRITMMMTTALTLVYFANLLNNVSLYVLFFFYIIAIIVKGVSDIFENKKNG